MKSKRVWMKKSKCLVHLEDPLSLNVGCALELRVTLIKHLLCAGSIIVSLNLDYACLGPSLWQKLFLLIVVLNNAGKVLRSACR